MRSDIGAFEDYEYEVEHVTDLGSGAVVAAVTETGRGKNSGVPVSRSIALLYTVIAGVIVRITVFPAERDAREDVGKTQYGSGLAGQRDEPFERALKRALERPSGGAAEGADERGVRELGVELDLRPVAHRGR